MKLSGGNRRLGKRSRLYEMLLAPLSIRERTVFSIVIVATILFLVITNAGASNSMVGSFIYSPFTACDSTGAGAWSSLIQATGLPDAGKEPALDFSRMAISRQGSAPLVCGGAETDNESKAYLGVRLYIATTADEPAAAGHYTEGGSANEMVIDQPKSLISSTEAGQQLDNFIHLEWSEDDGRSWKSLASIAFFEIATEFIDISLPATNAPLGDIAIRLNPLLADQDSTALAVDSAGITYQVVEPAILDLAINSRFSQSDQLIVPAGRELEASLSLDLPQMGAIQGIARNLPGMDDDPLDVAIRGVLSDHEGNETPVAVHADWRGTSPSGSLEWGIRLSPPRQLKPGAYTLKTTVETAQQTISASKEILWGVIAINTAKSSYQPGAPIEFMLSLLDERGATVCDADIVLDIKRDGQTITTLSTAGGEIKRTDTCQQYGSQLQADYIAVAQIESEGLYDIELAASNSQLSYRTTDTIKVETNPILVINRYGPTRLFPVNHYPMTITVDFNHDFSGRVFEFLPDSFKLVSQPDERNYRVDKIGGTQRITWEIEARAGDSLELKYTFDPPDISPAFFTLGKLEFESADSTFIEPRYWQLAGDAVGRMILFYDGATAPTGWTCISCAPGDPFYQQFIRSDEAFGGTGGSSSHSHTADGTVDVTTDLMVARSNVPNNQAQMQLNNNDHTHSFTPTIGSSSHLPSYRELMVIRHNTAGQPTTLPSGVIALFDADVPTGWTQYSAQNGYYIRGGSSAGAVGGNNSHTHAITGTLSDSSGGERRRATASTQADVAASFHTHNGAGTSSSASSEPPYLSVVFGQLDTAGPTVDNMLALWDDTPPTEWITRSETGGPFNQMFIKASSSYGATGGNSSHNHPDTNYNSGPSSAATTSREGGALNASDDGHVHNINVVNFSSESNLPPYTNAIVAKKQPVSTLEQVAYRWYSNQDSTDVGAPLASQNTATATPAQGVPFRLRFLLHVSGNGRGVNGAGLKLQYALRSGSCDTSFIGETYSDVSDSSGEIRYYNNSSVSDADSLTNNANDPTHSSHNVNSQSYEEANNFTNGQSAIPAGEDGMWDIALVDHSATPSSGYCFRVVRSTNNLLDAYSVIPEVTTDDGAAHMLLLWDGGGLPSGWSCVSCNPGDDFYQRFIRGNATYGDTGGNPTHSHTATATLNDSTMNGRGATGTGLIRAHSHDLTPIIGDASNLPSYRNLKVIRADLSGTPGTLPAGAIAFFSSSPPSGWTQYTAQDGLYIRGEGTAGGTGGSNNHSHSISGTTTPPTSGALRSPNTAGAQQQNATDGHTHAISGNSTSASNEPPFINVILAKLDSDANVPSGMAAMWDGTPTSTWTVHSDSGGPVFERFVKPVATFGGNGGSTSHSHTNTNINTSSPDSTDSTRTGGTNTSDGSHTHTATINGFSDVNHIPPYIDVVFAQLTGSNTVPDDPVSLDQIKISTTTSIATGGWANDLQVGFSASLSDSDNPDNLSICVEAKPLNTSFTNTESACSPATSYSGSPVTASVTLFGLSDNEAYHWQARTKDGFGAYSGWVSFGDNNEDEADFIIDSTPPEVTIFDGDITGVDKDFNDGQLDSLDANWQVSPPQLPGGLPGLVLWLDGRDPNASGVAPSDGAGVATWFDKSGNGNDISGTGSATYSSAQTAITFNDQPAPFDDNYNRSGGDDGSAAIFAVVTGDNANNNNVWFETTTPRVAPGERGLLGAGTQLSNNNMWPAYINQRAMFSLLYDSGGQSQGFLNGNLEYTFSETPSFSTSQRLVIGDDTTGGNQMINGEYIHEILIFNQNLTQQQRRDIENYLDCKWDVIGNCYESPVDRFEYSIGTNSGATDIVDWQDIGSLNSINADSLNLKTSQTYYFNVLVHDEAGNSAIYSSDGILVAPTLSFSASPGSIVFEDLSVSNGYTASENTVLTTSTNAYRGYEIRAYLPALPLSAQFDVIGAFDGGTYAVPGAWEDGDTGYGFTSNDSTIQGVNLFGSSPCAGGGSPPCFAPFSLTPPGEIVADHTDLIVGTGVANENYIVTHRVTVNPTQPAGAYQTLVIYSATAKY